jgi:hypothetical protein
MKGRTSERRPPFGAVSNILQGRILSVSRLWSVAEGFDSQNEQIAELNGERQNSNGQKCMDQILSASQFDNGHAHGGPESGRNEDRNSEKQRQNGSDA